MDGQYISHALLANIVDKGPPITGIISMQPTQSDTTPQSDTIKPGGHMDNNNKITERAIEVVVEENAFSSTIDNVNLRGNRLDNDPNSRTWSTKDLLSFASMTMITTATKDTVENKNP